MMHLLFNDLSINRQFDDPSDLLAAFRRVKSLRDVARSFGRDLYFHREVSNRMVNNNYSVFHYLRNTVLSKDETRYLMRWFEKTGPYWEDVREHSPDDMFVCNGELVTDEALAEAAHCIRMGIDSGVVSIIPSDWGYSPLSVIDDDAREVDIANFLEPLALDIALKAAEPEVRSWRELEERCRRRFCRITFLEDCFNDLVGRPFNSAGAKMVMCRLEVLDQLMGSRDNDGRMAEAGRRLLADQFVGARAPFSDSSDKEKNEFRKEMTFRHPSSAGEGLFCPWHGKVSSSLIRIHFSWPLPANGPLYVAYIGRKITTR